MDQVNVTIVRAVDSDGWLVAAELVDAEGRCHAFIDKLPIFWIPNTPPDSYPQQAALRCTVLERWLDARGRALVRIHTGSPDGVESSEGATQFVVPADEVTSSSD